MLLVFQLFLTIVICISVISYHGYLYFSYLLPWLLLYL